MNAMAMLQQLPRLKTPRQCVCLTACARLKWNDPANKIGFHHWMADFCVGDANCALALSESNLAFRIRCRRDCSGHCYVSQIVAKTPTPLEVAERAERLLRYCSYVA